MLHVRLEWRTGLKQPVFRNVRLMGSWDVNGRYSDSWSSIPMEAFVAEDGCPAWRAEVPLDDAQKGWTFHWGVLADTPQAINAWCIPTEVEDPNSQAQYCNFTLQEDGQAEHYWLTHSRRFGANKFLPNGGREQMIRFSVWAPDATKVELVTGNQASGYIWNNGNGVEQSFALDQGENGIWYSPATPEFSSFADWDHTPYMYRIHRDDGLVKYRTDLYSRCQIGSGRKKPDQAAANGAAPWDGTRQDVNGTKSCSVVIDPDRVTECLDEGVFPETKWLNEEDFWANEFDPLRPVPDRLEELVIYELHVEGLGAGTPRPGTFEDAIGLLDHLVDLGVNAVELMPMSEAGGWSWGYGTSHYFATDYAGGGRDQLKHFIRECHRRGIAVILDVVYNHYVPDAERAQFDFDAVEPDKNLYYWYEGAPSDWPNANGGYLNNGSSGWAPNYRNEFVRKVFTSSAAMLLTEFHVDGFRVDLTQAFHRDNSLNADGRPCPEANLLGAKFLREWVRTLRLIKPSVILTAEDHTGWEAITQPQETGGIGFDASWWAEWYHNLIGASRNDMSDARLLHTAGLGGNGPLAMSVMAEKILATPQRVIYSESHDEAGNAYYEVNGQKVSSARTIEVAVNNDLNEQTRPWAEARCRVTFGLTVLTPGTPMFFMGEEVGAKEPYRYNDWLQHREDILSLRSASGAHLFAFYRDAIRLRRREKALMSPYADIVHVHDANRVIAFRRWLGNSEFLIVASLNNAAFSDGYRLENSALPDGKWIEALNSDNEAYNGHGVRNLGALTSSGGAIDVRLPAVGIVVLQRI